ncbi:MAG: polysaccharide biosynthesis protein, partial [Patescibacteria group bacterium]
MQNKIFKGKKIIILGGTGSIGKEILDSLIQYKPKLIRIFSRDEYKQHQLRYKYFDEKNIDYVLGDIRD